LNDLFNYNDVLESLNFPEGIHPGLFSGNNPDRLSDFWNIRVILSDF